MADLPGGASRAPHSRARVLEEKKQERKAKEASQREQDGVYIVLERPDTPTPPARSAPGTPLRSGAVPSGDMDRIDSICSTDLNESRVDTVCAVHGGSRAQVDAGAMGPDNMIDPPDRTDGSVADPLTRADVASISNLASNAQSVDLEVSAQQETPLSSDIDDEESDSTIGRSSDDDDDNSEDDCPGDDEGSDGGAEVPRSSYVVNGRAGAVFGARRDSDNRRNAPEAWSLGQSDRGVVADEHFSLHLVGDKVICRAHADTLVTRHAHRLRVGDVIEFPRGQRVEFASVDRKMVKCRPVAASTEAPTCDVELPSDGSGVSVGEGASCAIRLRDPGGTPSKRPAVVARLRWEKDGSVYVRGEGEASPVCVCLAGTTRVGTTSTIDRKMTRESAQTNAPAHVECELGDGDLISIPGTGIKYRVTLAIRPRTAKKAPETATWRCVRSCAVSEKPNFSKREVMEDRAVVCDGVPGHPNSGLFCVFDGHEGRRVADFLAASTPSIIGQELTAVGKSEAGAGARSSAPPTERMWRTLTRNAMLGSPQRPARRASLRKLFVPRPTSDDAKSETSDDSSIATGPGSSVQDASVGAVRYVENAHAAGVNLALRRACERLASLVGSLYGNIGEAMGSTGVICYLCRDAKDLKLHTASVGDSGAVLVRGGRAVEVSAMDQHKPSHESEKRRIVQSGGTVKDGRMFGQLGVSRAFGDLCFKAFGLLSEPCISEVTLQAGDTHLIVASDGLWGSVRPSEAARIVTNDDGSSKSAVDIAEKLAGIALKRQNEVASRGGDNVTVVVAELPPARNTFTIVEGRAVGVDAPECLLKGAGSEAGGEGGGAGLKLRSD